MRAPSLGELPPPPAGRVGWPWTEASAPLPPSETWPRLSVVTPSFNQGAFLEETIRSVLLQGYSNLEYIIVDGGSTDGSVALIQKYAPWLAFWTSETDRGQSHALNKGFQRATGEVVAWLNSDDAYLPDALGHVARAFREAPAVGLVYGDVEIVDQQGHLIERRRLPDFQIEKLLDKTLVLPQPATFVRRALLREGSAVREELHYAMDFALWLSIAPRTRVQHLPRPLARFRLWEGSKSGAQMERWGSELLQILDDFFADPALPPDLRRLRQRAYSGAYSTGGANFYHAGDRRRSRTWLLRAALLYPPALWRTRLGARLALALLGPRGFQALRRVARKGGAE